MKKYLIFVVSLFLYQTINSQERKFEPIVDLEATTVISQGNTGTCWSFSTSSFLESEIMRLNNKQIDISEMYSVRHTYPKKAWTYVMRQGKAQFSEGGLAHDVINSIAEHGLVPNYVYSGLFNGAEKYNHSKLVDTLKIVLNTYIKSDKTEAWQPKVNAILDAHLGQDVSRFSYEGKEYTPKGFMKILNINPKNYVTITSFTHKPFYTDFILNIPDNFSNGRFYNVSLDELVAITNNALKNGYTIELDCDVSEKTFSSKYGIAVIPKDDLKAKDILTTLLPEKDITPKYRQQEFENYNTTDDHLMHITGMLKDQNGTVYYKVKNSWGKDSNRVGNGGYIYMSEAYFRLKTISIMVHKDAIQKEVKDKFSIFN